MAYKVENTRLASNILEDTFQRFKSKSLGNTIRAAFVRNITGHTYICHNAELVAVGFESNLAFDLHIIVYFDPDEIEVEGKVHLSDDLLSKDQRFVSVVPTWKFPPSGFAYNQCTGLLGTIRTKKALQDLYRDYIDTCEATFLGHMADSEVVEAENMSAFGTLVSRSTGAYIREGEDEFESDSDEECSVASRAK